MTRDLTEGNSTKLIFRFFLPYAFCNILQQIYNVADTVIVGRMVNADALAAVGATGSVSFLFLGFLSGITAGCAVPVASHFGAKQYGRMREYVAQGVYLTVIVSAGLTAVTIPLTDVILTLMKFPGDIYGYARQYMIFTFAGTVCLAFYNFTANILRAAGDSKTPLMSLCIATVLNIVLNIFFVKIGLAVIGVALATMIAQLFSALFCVFFIYFKLPVLFPKGKEWRFSGKMIKRTVGISLPMGLQMSVIAVGTIVVQTVLNTLGTIYVTAFSTAAKIMNIFHGGIMESLGTAMVPYCSQNLGAHKIDRIRKGARSACLIMLPIMIITALCFWFAGSRMVALFLDAGEPGREKIIELGAHCLRVSALFVLPLASIYIFRSIVQGLGFSNYAMFGGLAELIARCLISVCFLKSWGYDSVVYASPIAWVAAGVLFPILYVILMRRIDRAEKSRSG